MEGQAFSWLAGESWSDTSNYELFARATPTFGERTRLFWKVMLLESFSPKISVFSSTR